MDHIQATYHHDQFVILGLCSGADDGLATAQQDERVKGLVLLNGYAYKAGKFKLYKLKEFYLPRLFMLKKWVNTIKNLLANTSSTTTQQQLNCYKLIPFAGNHQFLLYGSYIKQSAYPIKPEHFPMTTLKNQSINSPLSSNKPVDDQPNILRRRVMQGAALSTAAIAVPGLANALCTQGVHTAAHSENTINVDAALTGDDVAIKLVETDVTGKHGKLARVTIKNNSHRSIKLNHVSPGAISTQKGVYQLNATLSNNPLSLRPGGAYQFWLTPDDGTQALLSSKPKSVAGEVNMPTTLEVSVITQLESGRWMGTQRLQALIS